MSMTVIEALATLDPTNDEHWTSDKLPRLDVVKKLTGNDSLSREDVTKAVKGFSRSNTSVIKPEEKPKQPAPNPEELTGTQPAPDQQTGEQTAPQDPPEKDKEPDTGGNDDEEKAAMSPEKKAEVELKEAQVAFSGAQKRLRAAENAMDAILAEREREEQGRTGADAIKAFQQSQLAQRAGMASSQRKLSEILGNTVKSQF